MNNLFKKNIVYLLLFFCQTLIMCFIAELVYFEFQALNNINSILIIFTTVWIFIVFKVLYFIFKKTGIFPNDFHVLFIFHCFLIYTLGSLFAQAIGFHKTMLIDRNYLGISSEITGEQNEYGGWETISNNLYVFFKKDKSLTHEINKLEEDEDEESRIDFIRQYEFIFWQTALSKGFEPKNIHGYNCCEDFLQMLKLYLTAGPLSIIECLIRASTPAFLLLIIPIISLLFKRRPFFVDMEGLRKLYK